MADRTGLVNRITAMLRDRKIRRQLFRYFVSGLMSASAEYLILYSLTDFKGIWYISSNTIALTVGFWISFLLNRYWTFGSKKKIMGQLALYCILFAFNLGASNLIIFLLTEKAGLYYMLSKLAATAVIVMWNFLLYRKIIYTDGKTLNRKVLRGKDIKRETV